MDLESTKIELEAAYQKLTEAEERESRLNREINKQYKIHDVLIAAGFITREKLREAESILDDL